MARVRLSRNVLVDIFMRGDFRLLEMFSALSAIWWGVWLLLPVLTGIPSSLITTSGWRVMANLAPDYFWGMLSLTLGTVSMHCLIFQHNRLRKYMSSVMFLFWLLITVSLALNTPVSTGVPVYGMRALGCALVYLRLETSRDKM